MIDYTNILYFVKHMKPCFSINTKADYPGDPAQTVGCYSLYFTWCSTLCNSSSGGLRSVSHITCSLYAILLFFGKMFISLFCQSGFYFSSSYNVLIPNVFKTELTRISTSRTGEIYLIRII